MNNIRIIEKPSNISWNVIHEILLAAHSDKNKEGGAQATAFLTGEQLMERVGKQGKCFIALVDSKVVGTASVSLRDKKFWFHKGRIAYYCFAAILPDWQGRGIFSKLNKARDVYVKDLGVNVIYIHTSHQNKKMQNICKKHGYRLVGFHAFKETDYFSVTLAKWTKGYGKSKLHCFLRYFYYMIRVRLYHRDRT